ncbi:S-adenosyl-L-methionine-dependent methyltransferase [Gigaspora margarita]|uniref:S-adenosyl-L-methionine-dependent methyltransferase n=1 Tax=Gigaspora margarita TaxID=4874 RepID=A0A8H3WWN6_GIGMA|nr:S-adenosyl-L-methionine-dependent methyltransferase [Gigaspora margarita]
MFDKRTTMSKYSQSEKYKEKKLHFSLIKDPEKFKNFNFYTYQAIEHAFNGSIGTPVHEMLQTGTKVLEFGCGTGIWTTEVSEEYPNSKFYAVDFAMRNSNDDNITFISCDIHQMLPFQDNEFDYVFSRNKMNFFAKEKFQGFLFEIFRILKPGGWLEIEHSLPVDVNNDACASAITRINAAYVSWHKERGIDFDLITRLEDYLKMTRKVEFITSRIVKILLGGDDLGEFVSEAASYFIKLIKELLIPYMGIEFEEYDHLVNEVENKMKVGCGGIFGSQKKVFAKKKKQYVHS